MKKWKPICHFYENFWGRDVKNSRRGWETKKDFVDFKTI